MKIDINKKYRTKEGHDVEFLHRVPEGWPTEWPWRGIAEGCKISWRDDGSCGVSPDAPLDDDLIEVREPREGWIAAHQMCSTAAAAEAYSGINRVIRVREIID